MNEKPHETAMVQASQSGMVLPDYGFDVARVVAMRQAVTDVIDKVLREGEHYGVIPGTTAVNGKPRKALLQPGAEVLCQVFRYRPEFKAITTVERDDFVYFMMQCRLFHSVTGEQVGEAMGSANTREEKFAAQTAARVCPNCGKATIFKSKKREGDTREPGWFCWVKKGGCGSEFAAEDKKLLDQTGAVSVDKVWNLHHTVLSQAQKRAYVRAVRNATGCSAVFTDEDAPPDDDDHGIGGHAHQRTQTKSPAVAKISATQIRDLSDTLIKVGIGTQWPENVPEAERAERGKKARLAWVNGMLADAERVQVNGISELPADVVEDLIAAAKVGKAPQGW